MKITKNLILSLMMIVLLSACGGSTTHTKTLKLAHGLDQKHSVHLGLVYMGERLKELSGGKMDLEIYPSGQLGSETQCIELLQIGSLALTKVSAAALENFVEEFKVFGIPYIFESKEHLFKVVDSEIGEDILKSTEPYMFRGLGYFDSGARSFYTNKKLIEKPSDLNGMKIRVMKSPVAVEMMRQLGGSATPISWGELYTALQSGVVDGAENNTPSYVTSFHYEVSRNFSFNEHTMIPDVIIISQRVWNRLDDQEKAWLQEAMQDASRYQRALWAKQEKECLEIMKEKGVNIAYPDKAPFIEMVRPMHDEFMKNPRLKPLIERIDRVKETL